MRFAARPTPALTVTPLSVAVTALLFKMEEANLASRAKAQELIQATNQVGSHGEESPQPLLLSIASGEERNYNSQQALGQGIGQKRSLLLSKIGKFERTEGVQSPLFPSTFLGLSHSLLTDPQPSEATLHSGGDPSSCTHFFGPTPRPFQLPASWQPPHRGLWLYPSYPHWAGPCI